MFLLKEAVTRMGSIKKVFLKILRNSQENTFARVSFLAMFEETHFQCSTQSECKNERSVSFRVINLAFWYPLCFYRTRYHGLPFALPYMLPYFYGNFPPFLLVTIFSPLTEKLLNVVQYIFSKIST